MAFYELRQYKVLPGQMDLWVKYMEEEIIPYQVSKGMVICGSFRHETDDSVYIWIRRFESEEQREKLYAAVYEAVYWKERMPPVLPSLLVIATEPCPGPVVYRAGRTPPARTVQVWPWSWLTAMPLNAPAWPSTA